MRIRQTVFSSVPLIGLALLSIACNPMSVTGVPAVQAVANSNPGASSKPGPTATPTPAPTPNYSCLDNAVDYELRTSVTDFELTGSGGLSFSLSPGVIPAVGVSLGVNYSSGALNTTMSLWQPLNPVEFVVQSGGQGTSSNFTMSASILAGLFGGGPSYSTSTPLSVLTNDAITKNLQNLDSALANVTQTTWWTHISLTNSQAGFFIPVGSSGGVEVGDQFLVMDATYIFSGGAPCKGNLEMAYLNSTKPLASGIVQQVGLDYAYVAVPQPNANLTPYSYVTYGTLKADHTSLPRSLRIGAISTPLIPFSNGSGIQNVDLTPFISAQILQLVQQTYAGEFYLHN